MLPSGSGAVKKAAKGTKDKEVEPSVGNAGESTTSHGDISVEEVEEEGDNEDIRSFLPAIP